MVFESCQGTSNEQAFGRGFRWVERFRRLAWDYERLPETLIVPHLLAFAALMVKRVIETMLRECLKE